MDPYVLAGPRVQAAIEVKKASFSIPFHKMPGLNESSENDPHHVRALALMSYRCQFFVNLQSLAEQLCSSYLRFVADVSDHPIPRSGMDRVTCIFQTFYDATERQTGSH